GDELVEHGRRVELNVVLIDIDARRLRAVVLLGDIDPIIAHRARKYLALVERILRHLALGHIRRGLSRGEHRNEEQQRKADRQASKTGHGRGSEGETVWPRKLERIYHNRWAVA